MNRLTKGLITLVLIHGTDLYASQDSHFYVSAVTGIFQANFNSNYLDISDTIPQNITQPALQNNYTWGGAIGYSKAFTPTFFLGLEVNANMDGGNAVFQSGASTAAFSDTVHIKSHFDLDLAPGLWLSSSVASYLKLGVSRAYLADTLVSPIGYNPIFMTFSTTQTVDGFAAAIGIKKIINDHFAVFTEYNYHDYGSVKFPDFQNFTANYSHSAHIYSYGVLLGATYSFNC